MRITGIAPWKSRILVISFDEGDDLYLHRDVAADAGLAVGESVEPEDIRRLRQAAAERRTYEYALYLLDRRSYSYRELYDKLMHVKQPNRTACEKALARLVRYGMINDARYAAALAETYLVSRKYGRRRAEYEMKRRGISERDIAEALAPYQEHNDVQENLLDLLERKYARKLGDGTDYHAKQLVTASLVRRGFDYRDIKEAIETYLDS